MLLYKSCFGSSCDSHHLLLLVVISVLQTDLSASIDCYINIISVNDFTVFNCNLSFICDVLSQNYDIKSQNYDIKVENMI